MSNTKSSYDRLCWCCLFLRIPSKTYLKRNFSKVTFQSGSSFERPTLSEKLKMTSRSRSKENNNHTRRERALALINQYIEAENNKTLEPKMQ